MKKILLDTNFLLIPFQFNVDIFTEIDRIILNNYKIYVLDKTLEELESIIKDKNQKLKNKNAAKLGLQLVKAKKLNIIKTDSKETVDDIIVNIHEDYIVATQDIELKRRLNAKTITLRQKQHLILK